MRESLARIIKANQESRSATSRRTSRLMDALIGDDGEEFTDAVNDILDEATGVKKKDGEEEESDPAEKEPKAKDPRA